jgi:hypothetical protein
MRALTTHIGPPRVIDLTLCLGVNIHAAVLTRRRRLYEREWMLNTLGTTSPYLRRNTWDLSFLCGEPRHVHVVLDTSQLPPGLLSGKLQSSHTAPHP